jgi:hypothetical protein
LQLLSVTILRTADHFTIRQQGEGEGAIVNATQDHMVNPLPVLGFAKLIHAQALSCLIPIAGTWFSAASAKMNPWSTASQQ